MTTQRSKRRPVSRQYSAKESMIRKYHRQVRRLESMCEKEGIQLRIYEDATDDDVCVLSSNDFEIGEPVENCDPSNENYFTSFEDYQKIVIDDFLQKQTLDNI